MKFELSHDRRSITNQDLIVDMRCVANAHANSQFTQALYRQHGKYGCTTTIKRFGTWNAAVEAAGLRVIRKKNISEQELFTALGELWIRLGRQPKYAELTKPYFPIQPNHMSNVSGPGEKPLRPSLSMQILRAGRGRALRGKIRSSSLAALLAQLTSGCAGKSFNVTTAVVAHAVRLRR